MMYPADVFLFCQRRRPPRHPFCLCTPLRDQDTGQTVPLDSQPLSLAQVSPLPNPSPPLSDNDPRLSLILSALSALATLLRANPCGAVWLLRPPLMHHHS